MKKFYYLLASMAFVLILIASCEKAGIESDELNALQDEVLLQKNLKADKAKVGVCHYDADLDTYVLISIRQNGYYNGHKNHEKDVLLIDNDKDGFVTLENECVPYGDCDDNNADVNPEALEICGDGIDDDCDGEIDEYTKNACGLCGTLPKEVFDGIDNDCDGMTDEEVMPEGVCKYVI